MRPPASLPPRLGLDPARMRLPVSDRVAHRPGPRRDPGAAPRRRDGRDVRRRALPRPDGPLTPPRPTSAAGRSGSTATSPTRPRCRSRSTSAYRDDGRARRRQAPLPRDDPPRAPHPGDRPGAAARRARPARPLPRPPARPRDGGAGAVRGPSRAAGRVPEPVPRPTRREELHRGHPVRPQLPTTTTVRSRIVKERGVITAQEVAGEPNAETRVELLEHRDDERLGPIARYRLTPHTGRTHQLRLHLASLGVPILGDPFYPDAARRAPRRLPHPAAAPRHDPRLARPGTGERREVHSRRTPAGLGRSGRVAGGYRTGVTPTRSSSRPC